MKKLFTLSLLSALFLSSCIMYNGLDPNAESESDESDSLISSLEVSSSESLEQSSSYSSSEEISSSSSSSLESSSTSQSTTGDITVYLLLSPVGQYKGVSGVNIPELHLENCYVFTGPAGSDLPGEQDITVTSGKGKFVSWMYYAGGGAPIQVDKVPSKNGLILYANFTKGDSSYVAPEDGTSMTYYFTNNYAWTDVSLYLWSEETSENNGAWPGQALSNPVKNSFNEDVYSFSFNKGKYTHCIISGTDGTYGQVQTLDINFSYFGQSNNFYLTGWENGKATVGFALFTPAN